MKALRDHYGWLLVALVVGGVHAGALDGGFHYDDTHHILRNRSLDEIGSIARYFVDPTLFSADADRAMYRPVLLASYAINKAVLGDNAASMLWVNLLIHMGNAALVCLIARRWLTATAAILAGLLFGLHPVVTEPVNYVSARSDSLVALFILISIWLAGRRSSERVSWQAVPAGVLALLTKSTAIAMAPMLALSHWLATGERQGGAGRGWGTWVRRQGAIMLLASGGYLALIWLNGFLPRSLGQEGMGWSTRIPTQIKALTHYLHTLTMPVALSPEPAFETSTWSSMAFLASAILVLSTLWLGLVAVRRRWRGPLAVLLWGGLCLVPVGLAPLNVLVNDRRLYLPLVAVAIAVAAVTALIRHSRWRPAVAVAGLGAMAVLSAQRSDVWATDIRLWSDATETAPMMPRAHLYLGDAHMAADRVAFLSGRQLAGAPHRQQARQSYERVLALEPHQAMLGIQAGNGLALIDLAEGRTAAARTRLEAILEGAPDFADGWVNLGNVHYSEALAGMSDAYQEALTCYDRALSLQPGRFEAHLNRGAILQMTGRLDEAETAYQTALEMAPHEAGVARNLGGLYMQKARLAPDRATKIANWRRGITAFDQAAKLGNTVSLGGLRAAEDSLRVYGERP